MKGIEERQKAIVTEFLAFSNWEERYRYIIQLGRQLKAMDSSLKTEENQVRGCQSQVWMVTQLNGEGKLEFVADSEALIVKGLLSLLIRTYSGSSCEDILSSSIQFISDLGLDHHLSPSRSNGIYSIIKKIKYYAMAYSVILDSKKSSN